MKSRRYQAQEPQNKNQKKDQNYQSPDEKNQQVNDNRQEKDIQRQSNAQKAGQANNLRQEKQSSKQAIRQNNYVQNQYAPTSPYQATQNSFQQIAQQMQNAVQVLPQPQISQFQMPNMTQQFPNTSQILNCMNTSPFMGVAPFQPPASQTLPQMNIDSQQYFELQKQIILQQHVIQMQAQVAQLQHVAQQQQKLNQSNPFAPQQIINQQPVFEMGYNGAAFRDTSLIQNFNHPNFQNFAADNYQQHNNNRNEEQLNDLSSSQDDQRKVKNKKQGNIQQKEGRNQKIQNAQSTANNQKDQKSNMPLNEKNQNKKGTQKIDDNQNSYSDEEIQDQDSSQQNQTYLLGKRRIGTKLDSYKGNVQKSGTQTKSIQPQQNKVSKIQSGKDLNESNNLAANQQNIQSDPSGFRRSTRSIAKYEPLNQGLQSKNKEQNHQDSGQKKQISPRKVQVQPSQKKDRSFSPILNSSQKKSTSPIQKYKNNSYSPNQGKTYSKNSSPTDKKGINSKSANSNTDTVVANEYAQILDQNKKVNNKTMADNILINQSKRTTRNQLKKFTNGEPSNAQTAFLELGDYGRKQTVRLQKIKDQEQKKAMVDKKNPRSKLSKENNLSKNKNELQNISFSGKREAQTQIVQSQKIMRKKSTALSVQHQNSDSNSQNYDSENEDEDSQLMAELAKEKDGQSKKIELPKVEKIQILDDQQLKDMTVLFGMTNEQVEEIKKKQEEQLKALQEKSILFGDQINLQLSNQSQKQQNTLNTIKDSLITQIQNSSTVNYEQQTQEIIKIQEFKSVNNCEFVKEEISDSEMSDSNHIDNQNVTKSKTQKYQNDVSLIEINKKIENLQSNINNRKQSIVDSEEEVLFFGENQQNSILPNIPKQQDHCSQDLKSLNTSQIHEKMQSKLKVQENEYESLQQQIDRLQEKLLEGKLNGFYQYQIQDKVQNVANEEKAYAQDIEMKIELSELDEEMSDQTQSIHEYQQPIIQNQNEQKQIVQINEELEQQEIIQAQNLEIQNRQIIEQRNQFNRRQESIKFDRELANTLQFPQTFENLINFQKQIDQSLNLISSRMSQSSLSNLKEMIEKSCHRQFSLKSLRQIMFIAPQLYSHQWEMKQGKMELVIHATTQFEDLSSLEFTKDQEYIEKIVNLPFKTSHIKNRELAFRQLAFQHLLNDFEKFIKQDERLQSYNLYFERNWPVQFDVDNESNVPQIPLGAIKEQPIIQQKSTMQEFINANDSKSKFREMYSQIQIEEEQQIKARNQSQEIIKKQEIKNDQSDYTSDSETEDDNPQVNIQKQTGLTQETLNHIQMKQKFEEQEKQNKKELHKQQEAKANAETLVQISDQIWSIAQQHQGSTMYINKVMERIIENKRGQFWSKETLYEKIKILSKICGELYYIHQQPGGTMIKVHKNINLQNYNVHRRINEYFSNDLKCKQVEIQQAPQSKIKIVQEPQIQKQNNTEQFSQDVQNHQNRQQQHRSISSDRNIQQNLISQNHDNIALQNKQQSQGAFSKFNRQISQGHSNIHQYEVQNQSIQESASIQRIETLNTQRESNEEVGRGNSNENIFYRKYSNEKITLNVQNNFKNEQVARQKGTTDNHTNGSSVGTFLTGEECQSNKSIEAEAQQKQVVQQQRANQLTLRDESAFAPQQQFKNSSNPQNYNNSSVGTKDFSRELLEVTSQQAQAKANPSNFIGNQNMGERQMKFQSPSINTPQVYHKQYSQTINLSNQNPQKSNIPEIMEKVYQPIQQNANVFQMGSTNTFQNQMYHSGPQKQIIQNQRPTSIKEGEQLNSQYHQKQNIVDQPMKRNGSYSNQAEFSENFNQRMHQQSLGQGRNIQN